jgi:hypothetical protein
VLAQRGAITNGIERTREKIPVRGWRPDFRDQLGAGMSYCQNNGCVLNLFRDAKKEAPLVQLGC